MNKKHLVMLAAVGGLALWYWRKGRGSKAVPSRIPPSMPLRYAEDQGPAVVPGSEGGNVPLSHFAPMGSMNLDTW